MGDYIRSIISLSCFCSFMIPFLKHGSKLKKYVAFSLSVVSVASLLIPVYSGLYYLRNISYEYQADSDITQVFGSTNVEAWLLRLTDDELRGELCVVIKSKYGIDVDKNSISILYDPSDSMNISIIKVTIDLSDRTVIKNVREMESYLSEMLMCECEVIGA